MCLHKIRLILGPLVFVTRRLWMLDLCVQCVYLVCSFFLSDSLFRFSKLPIFLSLFHNITKDG